jgi:hypothetical protein
MAGLLLAAAMLAAPPLPSKVITVAVSSDEIMTGSIEIGIAVPSDSKLF